MAKRKKPAAGGNKSAALSAATGTTGAIVVSQPSVRTSILWTPAHILSLQLQVDGGDMTRLAELCDQMIADDRIGSLLTTLMEEVLGSELTFEKDDRSIAGSAILSPELDDDWRFGYDDDELTQLGTWTIMAGVGFAKHETWVDAEDGRTVPRPKWWHLKQFKYESLFGTPQSQRTWKVRDELGQWTPIKAGDGTWIIATRRGEFRPWANGEWRGLAPWWMLKQYAIQDWGVHSEKSSKLVATSNDTTTAEMRKSLARYVYEASKDAVISLPPGFDLKLIELAADTEAIYKAQVDAANEAFAITLLGQNLSSNVQGGSRAAAEVHERKENRKARYLAEMLAKCLQPQSLKWWVEYNFGEGLPVPYPRWHTEPPEDKNAKAAGLKTLGDALLAIKNAGYRMSVEQIEDDYGVALEEAPEPEVDENGEPLEPEEDDEEDLEDDDLEAASHFELASGDDPRSAPGFIAGQVYVDALTDTATALGAKSMRAFVERIEQAIEGAEDYEAVRYAVLQAFAEEEDPERLAELVQHAILLANLAGRNAVQEDVSE